MVTWVAYCPTCKEELAQAPNGALMEAVANRHADETGHQVILGFFLGPLEGVNGGVPETPSVQTLAGEGGAAVAGRAGCQGSHLPLL